MSSLADSVCPLCEKGFPGERLHQHIDSEHARLRRNTIQVIQAYHPDWVEEDGACEPCWKSFRDAGRMLDVLRTAKRQKAGDFWSSAQLLVQEDKLA